jgi:uncharacterized protein YwgA
MRRPQRTALLGSLCDKLRDHGSWCGETHVQKSVFVLEDMLDLDLDFDFVLYKYGPFSFDLRDELSRLRGLGLLGLEPRYPYGPRLFNTDAMHEREQRFPRTLSRHENTLDFVASRLGPKSVDELERIATALYVTKRKPSAAADDRAEMLRELKAHVTAEQALAAVEELDDMRNEIPTAA